MTRTFPPRLRHVNLTRRTALLGALAATAAPAFSQQPASPVPPAANAPREVRHTLNLAPAKARLRPSPPVDFDIWATDGVSPARPIRMKLGKTAVITVNKSMSSANAAA